MPQILLINPRSRKKPARRKKVAKKRRTAAQRAATRKLVALNRSRKRGGSKRRRRNPVAANPAKRRRRRKTTARRVSRRRRRNPIAGVSMRSVKSQVMEAGTGALGALGLDIANGYLPIPANLKGGIVGTGVKALLAIGIGVLAAKTKLVGASTAGKMANGALTVVLHDELKKQVQNFAPGIQMGEYLDYDALSAYSGSGYNPGYIDDPDALGTYLPDLSVGMQQDGFAEYLNSEADYN